MNTSIGILSRPILLSAALCASAWAAVPTVITVEGQVTGSDNHSIQIDDVSYEIEPGSEAARDLANVRRGDSVTLAISPRSTPGTAPVQHLVSQGHEVVHPATANTHTTVTVVHAPGVR
jgi:pyruvate/2-oxoacid:ferredoxin oxidoreductase alpha subunit